ncbi:MAG TPA: hypothetical protein VFT22_46015 [Kofleriaceae bacterium]|nr:hypothetical protein [Kofleriaceae bacterium]
MTGGGSVTSTPAGIDCGPTCTAELALGTTLTLTPTPDADSSFVGWSGDCTGSGTCTVTLDRARSVTATFALHGAKRWLAQVSFTGDDFMKKITVDPDGNVIAAGNAGDTGATGLYIIKYARDDGHVLWAQHLVTADGEDLGGLATDAAGDVYIGTRLSSLDTTPVLFGTTPVTGDLFGNIVILRLAAADGAVVWARQWGGTGQDIPQALAVSGTDLYVVGYTSSNPSTFDGLTLAASTNNGFVARASTADGKAAAVKLIPGTVNLLDVAVNGAHVAVVGSAASAFTLDTVCGISPSGSGDDALLLDLLGSTLACQWGKNFGDFTNNLPADTQAVAAYPGGGWVITGAFQGNILLAPSGSSLSSHGGFDVFAGRFAADGTHVWSFRYGDTGFDVGYGISATPDGNVLLAGVFDTTITFGAITVTGKNNTFVTRMSTGGAPAHEWAVSLGGDDSDLTNGVAVAPDGSVYVVTSFTGMTNIAGAPLTSQGYDSWIAALVR